MSLTNFPNGISSFGVPVLPAVDEGPITGNVYWVSSVQSAAQGDTNNGGDGTFEHPWSDIDYAIGQCTASNGDVIYVKPGHTETISAASGITLDVAGVRIIGIGWGSLIPTITLDTAATATFVISAADTAVSNFIFTANYADIATCFSVSAKNVRIDRCSFRETATNMNFLSCIVTSSTNNACDGLTITNCERISIDAAALAFLSVLGNLKRLQVIGNFDNQSSAANVGHFIIASSKVLLGARIIGNTLNLNGDNNAQTVGVFMTGSSSTSTGTMAYNLVGSLDTTTELIITAGQGFQQFENYYTGTADKCGKLWPAADAT
jgi:hypothetical protein